MPERQTTPGRTLGMGETIAVDNRAAVTAPFGHALAALAERDPRILGLSADLAKYTDILPFAEKHPGRFFNVGMAEQNLMAVAAGLAKCGFVPFVTTYAVFASRRALDFVAIAIAHSHLPVKIYAGLPGLTTGYGGTHQAIEDLALMLAVPGLAVIDPCDATEISRSVAAAADHDGPVYVRLLRGNVPVVFAPESHRFVIGRAHLARDGADIGVISTGLMTERALDAAALLAGEGLSVAVLHVATLKPFDAEAVLGFAARFPALVSAENHVASGGLGTRVAETLIDGRLARPLRRVGLPDAFIECGSLPHLNEKYGLSVGRLAAAIREQARAFVR